MALTPQPPVTSDVWRERLPDVVRAVGGWATQYGLEADAVDMPSRAYAAQWVVHFDEQLAALLGARFDVHADNQTILSFHERSTGRR